VTLNINTPSPSQRAKVSASHRQRRLVAAASAELLSWNPREFISVFRRWHHGAFSLIHLNVLTMLEADGPESMSRLAEALDVSVASMTGIVDRMEKRGLVERRHEGKDRRVVLVYPTDAGRDIFREIDERRRIGLGKLLEQLRVEELEGLLKGHAALRKARTAATAARLVEANTSDAQPAPLPPSRLHAASTIADDDRLVKPTTGARR
jgi:DNA-binding MarR family transcriptional regulator